MSADALEPMCRERRECNIGKKMRDREKTREEEKRRWLGRAATRRWPVEPIPPSGMFTSLTLEPTIFLSFF